MTEAEWLNATDPEPIIAFLTESGKERKLRLFNCACCRRIWPFLVEESRRQVEATEQCADGLLSAEEAEVSGKASYDSVVKLSETVDMDTVLYATQTIANVTDPTGAKYVSSGVVTTVGVHAVPGDVRDREPHDEAAFTEAATPHWEGERLAHVSLLRDIFGNPFRSVEFDAEWRTSTAVLLAKQMYESRDFDAMPILADALQDAGCDNADILSHCRDANGVHVRGCWVVDLVLGKQ
jgi:hypothetical protein